MNSAETDKEILRIKGHYFEKYGDEIDPWEARFYNETRENNLQVLEQMKIAIEEMHLAGTSIKGQVRNIQFNNWKPAFMYAFGKYFLIGFAVLIPVVYTINFIEKTKNVAAINAFYKENKEAILFKNLITNGEIIEKGEVNYLKLTPLKGHQLTIGEEYIFDEKNNRVLVPLGNKEENP